MTRRKKIFVGFIVAAIAVCSAPWLSDVYLDHQIEAETAALRKLGVPMSQEELDRFATRKGSDAAADINKAYEIYDRIPETEKSALVQAVMKPGVSTTETRFIGEFEHVLPDLERAASREVLNYNESYLGVSEELSAGDKLNSLESGLFDYLRVAAKKRDVDRTIRAITLQQHLLTLQRDRPYQFSFTLTAHRSRRLDGMVIECARLADNVDVANQLLKLIDKDVHIKDLRYFFYGQPVIEQSAEAMGEASLSDLWRYGPPHQRDFILATRQGRKTLRLQILRSWRKVFEKMPSDGKDVQAVASAHQELYNYAESLGPDLGELVPMAGSGPEWLAKTVNNFIASRRAARTLLRMYIERTKTGKWPTSIAKYGDCAIDPATGQPLKTILWRDSLVVYSVGLDGIDQKGTSWNQEGAYLGWKIR